MVRNYQAKHTNNLVEAELISYLVKIPDKDPIFEGTSPFSLVKDEKDKRKASWTHVITNLARNVANDPKSAQDCFISSFADNKGRSGVYAMHKFGPKNVGVHRTCAVLAFPNKVKEISRAVDEDESDEKPSSKLVVAHRCGSHKCFNPSHMVVVTQKENESHKGCRHGCAQLCPHSPKCIFVKEGRFLPCLNDSVLPKTCQHKICCHSSLKPRRLMKSIREVKQKRDLTKVLEK